MAIAVFSDYDCVAAAAATYRDVLLERGLRELTHHPETDAVVLCGNCAKASWSNRVKPFQKIFRAENFHCPESEVPDSILADAPALSVPPFAFRIFDLHRGTVETVELKNPEVPGLTDFHIHSPLAYCSENMNGAATLDLANLFQLKRIAFSEHSSHLYLASSEVWSERVNRPLPPGMRGGRIAEYKKFLTRFSDGAFALRSMELDIDGEGGIVASPEDVNPLRLHLALGAVHILDQYRDQSAADADFLRRVERFGRLGVPILAHPFRVFRWNHLPLSTHVMDRTLDLLEKYRMTPEINFHENQPEKEFFARVLDRGMKVSFGSDAHNLSDIGAFLPHFRFLDELGVSQTERESVLLSGNDFLEKIFRLSENAC